VTWHQAPLFDEQALRSGASREAPRVSPRRRFHDRVRSRAREAAEYGSPCRDCYAATMPPWTPDARYEWYMVHDHVWSAAGMGGGYLFIGCLEHRLGRQLTAADFTGAPVNSLGPEVSHYAWSQRSGRLLARLTGGLDPAVLAAGIAEAIRQG
jgi:hypothetical protein